MVDFLIVGGGVMGHALAYNIWRQFEKQTPFQKYYKTAKHKDINYNRIMVVEKDPTVSCLLLILLLSLVYVILIEITLTLIII